MAALSKDITTARCAAVDRRFKNEDESKLPLSKEGVKTLKARKEQDKLLSGGSYSYSSHRSHARGRRYAQKQHSFSKGKGKGNGKLRPRFNSQASAGKRGNVGAPSEGK